MALVSCSLGRCINNLLELDALAAAHAARRSDDHTRTATAKPLFYVGLQGHWLVCTADSMPPKT